MKPSRHPALAAILWGGFVAGTIDIGAASLISGYSPIVILKYVAGGLLGKSSLGGTASVAMLGLLLQWVMSIIIAAVFVMALHRRIPLMRRWPLWGVAYGVVIFFVMNYVVVPLSALGVTPHFSAYSFTANFAAMLLFGWIVACFARMFLGAKVAWATPPNRP